MKMKMKRRINDIKNFFKSINRSIVAMLVLTLAFTACVQPDYTPYHSKVTLRTKVLTFRGETINGNTVGDPAYKWDLQILSGEEFCTAQTISGNVGSTFTLRFSENNSGERRSAKIRVRYSEDGYENTFTILQLPKTSNPDYDHPWAEQPVHKSLSNVVYKTYYVDDNNAERIRNYSICYDLKKHVSYWVAYPVHSSYMGGSGRTNAWSYDDAYYTKSGSDYVRRYIYTNPVIPQSSQWDISKTFPGYQRGHVLPSATRLLNYNTNAQTFYAPNLVPQHGGLNGGVWATLEGKVRSWSCSDTLFVVTGALYESSNTVSRDGNTAAVPSHTYKVLLRTRSGNTNKHLVEIESANELKTIGFIFENNDTGSKTSIQSAAVSVADIERRSGFTFFRNLDPAIASSVKSQKNLKDWGL